MTQDPQLHLLLLAGGSGTRLWPLSRQELPKQFLPLTDSRSLLQETVLRVLRLTPPERIRVVTGESFRALVTQQAQACAASLEDPVISEPQGKNTAAAIALGVARLVGEGASGEDLVLVCPCDHAVAHVDRFVEAVALARQAAAEGYLVTFGIVPDRPETGYGYLQTEPLPDRPFLKVAQFVEKPDAVRAAAFLEEGGFFWNGGIFCFRVDAFLEALREWAPEIGEPAAAGEAALRAAYPGLPSRSIDYALMEKAPRVACVPLDAGWSDVGSWDAVYDLAKKDLSGNALFGDARLLDGQDNLVFARERLVVGVDLTETIVVDTPDAVFVAPRGSSQKVREVVRQLQEEGRRELVEAPVSARPWGSYRVVSQSGRYKVKQITILPGARLSLQYHHHRSEHWVVVQGTAKVEVDGTERLFHEGESVFVPKGSRHRLGNPGKIPLEIVEVQCGEYLGEDDIVRLSDDFRRVPEA